MDAKTLTALKGSIEKWKRIVKSTKARDKGTQNCPLCQLFIERPPFSCDGCPVKEKTGDGGCRGTPYSAWSYHHVTNHPRQEKGLSRFPKCPDCLRLAKQETRLLEGLLPKRGRS